VPKKKKPQIVEFGKDIERAIEKCPHQFEWSSDPNHDCSKCNYRKYCKAKFFNIKNPEMFVHNEEQLKREYFEKLMREGEIVGGGVDEVF